MAISKLETGRLILREHRFDDFPAYAALGADPDVTRYLGDGAPYSQEQSWANFLRQVGHWQMLGFGTWAVEEKASGKMVGGVGFGERKRDRGEALEGVPEIGWMFATAVSGKGYATEALGGALDWGKAHFGPIRVIAIIAPENVASIRVAEKRGFREFHRGLSIGRPHVFFDRVL